VDERVDELVDECLDLVVDGVGAVDRDLLGARREGAATAGGVILVDQRAAELGDQGGECR